MVQTTVPFRPDEGHMWNVSVARVCILTVLFVHILCNFSFHFFVALLLLRISLHLPPPDRAARNGEWKSMNCECWTGWMGKRKKIMVNVELKPEQWTAYKSYDVEVGEVGLRLILKARNTNASGQVNCGFYYSLHIIYPSDTPPFQYEPTQMIFEPFSICRSLRKQEVV